MPSSRDANRGPGDARQPAAREFRLIAGLTDRINRGADLDAVMDTLHAALREVVPCDRLSVGFLQSDGHTLVLGPVRSDSPLALAPGYHESIEGSTLKPLLETGATRILDDLEAYLAAKPASQSTRQIVREGMRSSLTVPLVVGDRRIGVMWFSSRARAAYVRAHEDFMRCIAGHVALVVERAAMREENARLREVLSTNPGGGELIGVSEAWSRVREQIGLVAPTAATVLLLGETGTGKELVARAIHRASARRAGPFLPVNCAALPGALVASELFGHERGAFTGAHQRRPGRIELAAGGTLFLDEVGELTPEIQPLLLRVLQTGEFTRVGGSGTQRADVRVIAATNRDLDRARADGRFREDLYYRLAVFPLTLPPLRERLDDIELLLQAFLARAAQRLHRRFDRVDPRTLAACQRYDWPGNVRELEHVVERAAILCTGPVFRLDFPLTPTRAPAAGRGSLEGTIRGHLAEALRASRGRIYGPRGAAVLLGLKPSTLQSKLIRFGLDRSEFVGD